MLRLLLQSFEKLACHKISQRSLNLSIQLLCLSAKDIPLDYAMEVDADRVAWAENIEKLVPVIKSVVSHHFASVLNVTGL